MTANPASADRAARAGAWSAIESLFRQGVQLCVVVVMARLLVPEDFGLIALLGVFTGLSSIVVESGPSVALIRNTSTNPVQESSIFWFNLGAAALCAALLISVAPLVARFYGFPLIIPLMGVAALQVSIAAFGAVPYAMLARTLQFKRLMYVGGTSSVISGTVGISLAALDFGVWAISASSLTAVFVNTIMLWIMSRWRPLLRFDFQEAKALFRFGMHFALSGFMDVLFTHGFALIIGKLHGIRDVAFYNRAYGTHFLPTGVLSQIIGRVSLPTLAERANDPEGLRRALRRSILLAMSINLPMMIGLSVLSDLVVLMLFGPVWLPSAPILTILAALGSFYPVHLINLQALLAQDRSRIYLWSTAAKQSLGILTVIVGSFFGIMGLAYSQIAYGIVCYSINTGASGHYLRYGPWRQLKDLSGLLGITAAMAASVMALRTLTDIGPPALELFVLTAVGAIVYVCLGLAFRVGAVMDIVSLGTGLLKSVRRRRHVDTSDV